ncbi:MAG: HAD family hydrolase [Saprospiraceae bacterium]|nr:HAD family hydrolase [Saprospiraceae bacterium]
MSKTLVIFDIDGTLVFSNKIDSLCFAETYKRIYGRPFPTIDWTSYPHVTDNTIFKSVIHSHFDRDATDDEIETFQYHFVSMLEEKRRTEPHEFQEVPGARKAVERLLTDDRYVVGIGTGGWYKPAMVKLRHVNIPTDSIVLVGADGHEKREGIIGQVVETVSKETSIARTVYVGDAIWDVNTTRRMGMNFIGIRRNGDFHVLQSEGTETLLRDYTDFDFFLSAIENAKPPKTITK